MAYVQVCLRVIWLYFIIALIIDLSKAASADDGSGQNLTGNLEPIEDTNEFTCTASSKYDSHRICEKLYDGDSSDGNSWYTANGQAKGSWIDIKFNGRARLSRIDIQHPDNGWFKDIRLLFSHGKSREVTLTNGPSYQWNMVDLSPAVETTYLRLETLTYYNPENLKRWHYGIAEILFYGNITSFYD